MTNPHSSRPARLRLYTVASALALMLLLGASVEGCLFLDVLTGLYTNTYNEWGACKLDAEGTSCQSLSAAHDACVDERGVGHEECRQLFDKALACSFCDFFFAEAFLSGSGASKQGRLVQAAAASEVYWAQSSTHIFRTVDGGRTVQEIFDAARWPLGVAVDADAGKVYWTDGRTKSLRRADLDGSNQEDLVDGFYGTGLALDAAGRILYFGNASEGTIGRLDLTTRTASVLVTGVDTPTDVAFDLASNTVYWTQNGRDGGSIQRLRLDGAGVAENLIAGLTMPFSLALDPNDGKLYWSDPSDRAIRRANLDGTGIEDVLTGLNIPGGLALDPANGRIYWADVETVRIRRANLDGTGAETLTAGSPAADLAVDAAGGKLYWTGWLSGGLSRANLDGSGVEAFTRPERINGDLAIAPGLGKVYWIVQTSGRIQRANLDGTQVENVGPVQVGLGAVAFDAVNAKLYWTAGGNVLRSDPDGSDPETVLTGIVFIGDIEVDEVNGKLYWINRQQIERANLDGTERETIFIDSGFPATLAVHEADGTLYWSVPFARTIRRVKLDGSGGVEDILTGASFPWHLAVSDAHLYWSLPFARTVQRGTLDGAGAEDVLVNVLDITGLALGPASSSPAPPDETAPECVLAAVLPATGVDNTTLKVRTRDPDSGLSTITPTAVNATVTIDPFVPGVTGDVFVYAEKIVESQKASLALEVTDVSGNVTTCDPIIKTVAGLPERYALDQNYPNPFNPRTTIAFGLAEAEHVALRVYDATGREVAVLVDGPLEAGTYEAVWDGRDASGRTAASGVYLYRLEAGDFMQTRSMLLLK